MSILIVNAGSSTLKWKLFEDDFRLTFSAKVEKKADKYELKEYSTVGDKAIEISADEWNERIALLTEMTPAKDLIKKLGYRVVHGGENYTDPTLISDQVLKDLDELNDLAPIHNPPAIAAIKELRISFPTQEHFAVFDTAFHKTMPEKAFLYGLPYEYYQRYGIRRYGFHGTSHSYLWDKIHQLEPSASKVITCHLGSGASITAIKDGKSLDTSMGFTPNEGLIMSTRAGDIDDGVLFYLTKHSNNTLDELENMELYKSGILGLSGISDDMRVLLVKEAEGNSAANRAIEAYIYRIVKYIGSFVATLGGLDALVLSAGIGVGSDVIRKRICAELEYLNIEVDNQLNEGQIDVAKELKISSAKSIPVWVIPTDEELKIAQLITRKIK